MKKTIVHIVGARPNFIKAAPVIHALNKEPINNIIIHTGQHYDYNMSKTFFEELNIPEPHYNLGAGGGSHTTQTVNIMLGCERVYNELKPDIVIVYGDINSCMAASVVASKMHLEGNKKIKIVHVESGLRSGDREMPEEINRLITDSISDILFVTSPIGLKNLEKEGVDSNKCHFVGNTMIDSLLTLLDKITNSKIIDRLNITEPYALITLHRASNVDSKESLENMMDSIVKLSEYVKVVFPMHPRTKWRLDNFGISEKYESIKNLLILEPLGYIDFMCLQKNAKVIVTDSGGVQEESSYFNVPCLTVRDNTERPITIIEGTNRLIGTGYDNIIHEFHKLSGKNLKSSIKKWDGKSADRIVKILRREFKW